MVGARHLAEATMTNLSRNLVFAGVNGTSGGSPAAGISIRSSTYEALAGVEAVGGFVARKNAG